MNYPKLLAVFLKIRMGTNPILCQFFSNIRCGVSGAVVSGAVVRLTGGTYSGRAAASRACKSERSDRLMSGRCCSHGHRGK